MAAPLGNEYAKNNGGSENRKKIAKVKRLTLAYIIKILEGDNEPLKKELVLKIATNVVPRTIEHEGQDGEAIKVNLINYGAFNSPQLHSQKLPAADNGVSGAVQGDSPSPAQRQDQDRA